MIPAQSGQSLIAALNTSLDSPQRIAVDVVSWSNQAPSQSNFSPSIMTWDISSTC